MKEILLGSLGIAAVGAGVYNFPIDSNADDKVYAMSQSDVVDKLLDAPIPLKHGPFAGGNIEASNPENGVVEWAVTDSDGPAICRAEIEDEGKTSARVKTFCNEEAVANLPIAETALELKTLTFREFVDSTLTDRAYDKAKIEAATIRTVITNTPKIQAGALKMQKEFEAVQAEIEESMEENVEIGTPSTDLDSEE